MKYAKNLPKTDENLSRELVADGWSKLKEPSSLIMAILLSLPFMVLNTVISLVISYYLYPPFRELLESETMKFSVTIKMLPLIVLILGSLIFMTIHELIHAFFIPNVMSSNNTYWGINGLYGFVFTTEKIKKGRFLLISIMPFFLLSIVLPFILSLLGLLNGYIIFFCLINAAGSCVDMLNMFLVIRQIPNDSWIINNGFETYFK